MRDFRTRDNSRPAYSSDGKNQFRYKLDVVFDFKDYNRSIRQVRQSVEEMNSAARDLVKKLNKTNRGYGVYVSANAVKSRGAQGNQLLNFPLPASGPELSSKLAPFLTEVGKRGKDIMVGYANRIETGLMRKSITYMQRRRGDNQAVVQIGWVRKWQKYFGWQEMGTRTIPPMHSIIRTRVQIEPEIQRMYSKFFRKEFLERGNR